MEKISLVSGLASLDRHMLEHFQHLSLEEKQLWTESFSTYVKNIVPEVEFEIDTSLQAGVSFTARPFVIIAAGLVCMKYFHIAKRDANLKRIRLQEELKYLERSIENATAALDRLGAGKSNAAESSDDSDHSDPSSDYE